MATEPISFSMVVQNTVDSAILRPFIPIAAPSFFAGEDAFSQTMILASAFMYFLSSAPTSDRLFPPTDTSITSASSKTFASTFSQVYAAKKLTETEGFLPPKKKNWKSLRLGILKFLPIC